MNKHKQRNSQLQPDDRPEPAPAEPASREGDTPVTNINQEQVTTGTQQDNGCAEIKITVCAPRHGPSDDAAGDKVPTTVIPAQPGWYVSMLPFRNASILSSNGDKHYGKLGGNEKEYNNNKQLEEYPIIAWRVSCATTPAELTPITAFELVYEWESPTSNAFTPM
jgi:hypothetical protein